VVGVGSARLDRHGSRFLRVEVLVELQHLLAWDNNDVVVNDSTMSQ
jgi:hypothetical protein